MLRVAIHVGLITCLLLPGCGFKPGSDYQPEKVFQYLIESPVPDSISSLQGDAQTFQGYVAWLRFKAPPQYIDSLTSSGFTPVEWQKISRDFGRLGSFDGSKFEPAWAPESLTNKKCYQKDVKNDWTHSGTHYLVIDRDNGIVYFYGYGD